MRKETESSRNCKRLYYERIKRNNPEKIDKWKENEMRKRRITRDKERELNPKYCEGCKVKLTKYKRKWCNKCGKIIPMKKWKENNKEKLKEYNRNWSRKDRRNPVRQEYQKKYRQTRLKELKFKITEKEFEEIIKNGCNICGWKYVFDIHHISKNPNKLICLCPNHHQLIHRNKIKLEDLYKFT